MNYKLKVGDRCQYKIDEINRIFIVLERQDMPKLSYFKLKDQLRHRIYKALKGYSKSKKTLELLGCSLDFLRLYLQSKFQPGMSFSNYGKWHIDQIIPCARFNLQDPEEQKKCFNWKNLQPLWAEENIKKSDKII